jgi:hypothetical protein
MVNFKECPLCHQMLPICFYKDKTGDKNEDIYLIINEK